LLDWSLDWLPSWLLHYWWLDQLLGRLLYWSLNWPKVD
jgi:hypothetical protein